MVIGACLYTAKELDMHELAPQLVRDIYPWGKLAHPKMRDLFMSLLVEVKRDLARMYWTILPDSPTQPKGKTNAKN